MRERQHPFDVMLGGAFNVLDPVMEPWAPEDMERPLRPVWDRLHRSMRAYLSRLDRENSVEADALAHMVARLLDEMADQLGDDRRLRRALDYAIGDDGRPHSAEELTLAEVRGQWGEHVVNTLLNALREHARANAVRKRPRH